MAKNTEPEPEAAAPVSDSPYAKDAEEAKGGKPIGPEHDKSFNVPVYDDPPKE